MGHFQHSATQSPRNRGGRRLSVGPSRKFDRNRLPRGMVDFAFWRCPSHSGEPASQAGHPAHTPTVGFWERGDTQRPPLRKLAIARAECAPRDWVGSDNTYSSSRSYAEVSFVSGHPAGLPGDGSQATLLQCTLDNLCTVLVRLDSHVVRWLTQRRQTTVVPSFG